MYATPYLWQKLKNLISLTCLYTVQVKRNEDDITLETKCSELSPSIDILMESICHARSKYKYAYFLNKVYFVIFCKLYYIKNPLTRWRNSAIVVGSVRRMVMVIFLHLAASAIQTFCENFDCNQKFS